MNILPRFKIQYPMKNRYKFMQLVLLCKFFNLIYFKKINMRPH
jgi:hypothetical protein